MALKTEISIEDLEKLVEHVDNPLEKEGLKAFIQNVTPKLISENTGTFLGKIKQVFLELPEDAQLVNALESLRDEYHVIIE